MIQVLRGGNRCDLPTILTVTQTESVPSHILPKLINFKIENLVFRECCARLNYCSTTYIIGLWKNNNPKIRVEAGSNTSTVTLRVLGGDEKGSLNSETVKYGLMSQGTRTRERLRRQGPAAHTKDRPDLSSERAPHKKTTVTVTQVIKIWS
jgi:hypothetical protein